jgi:hypothetical protein
VEQLRVEILKGSRIDLIHPALSLFLELMHFNPRVGYYYLQSISSGFGGWAIPANTLVATYCPVYRKIRFDRIGVLQPGAGGAGALMRVGVYSDIDLTPDSLLLDSGEFDATLTGWREATIDLTLNRGKYWLTYLGNDATITIAFQDPHLGILGIVPGEYALGPAMQYRAAQAYGPLPATFPAGTHTGDHPILSIMLRVAEVLE